MVAGSAAKRLGNILGKGSSERNGSPTSSVICAGGLLACSWTDFNRGEKGAESAIVLRLVDACLVTPSGSGVGFEPSDYIGVEAKRSCCLMGR
jgi:hypothetical protein